MNISQNYSLQASNSFNVNSTSPKVYFPSSVKELYQLVNVINPPFYILGEGSNTLFVESQAPVIVKPDIQGISVVEFSEHYEVTVGAGENWHQLVCFCLERQINGLENLALIPGSVGAAPVQNIGAYGVEFSDFCVKVEYFDFASATLQCLTAEQCQFSYRESIFKKSLQNRVIITHVTLSFSKKWQANLSYAGLDCLAKTSTAQEVMQQVIQLRQAKLPDPKLLPNAGSFFKNPVVSQAEFSRLIKAYPTLPNYPQSNGLVKLAAGWLIEQAGLKGFIHKAVGVHDKQALVLVNYNNGQGSDIVGLAKFVQQQVQDKFAIEITPEVRMISSQGEVSFSSLVDTLQLSEENHG